MTVDLNPIILSLIAAAVTLLTVYMTRVNANASKTLEATKVVHDLVNSKDTATQKSLDELRAEVLKLSTANATLLETARTAEITAAKAAGASEAQAATPSAKLDPAVAQTVVADEPLPVRVVAAIPVPVETETERGSKPPAQDHPT